VTPLPVQQGSNGPAPAQPAVAMNGTPKPVMPPTGPAAMNGSMSPQHSRASSTASNYRSPAQQPLHSAKPSMNAPSPYAAYPAQIPQIPGAGGRNSPFPEFHDDDRSVRSFAKAFLILESQITIATKKWLRCRSFHGSTWFEFLAV